jgi:hypothetical protein
MKTKKNSVLFVFALFLLIFVRITFHLIVDNNEPAHARTSASDRLEIRLYNVDDFSKLYVNEIKFADTKYNTDTGRIEVSQYLRDGVNTLRFLTQNNGGVKPDNPMSYGYQAWLNGEPILDVKCGQVGTGGCEDNRNFPGGKVYEKVLKVNIKKPGARNNAVNIKSSEKGWIYLNDEFTGKVTPSTLVVPTGSYRIGIGTIHDRYQELTNQISNDKFIVFNDRNWLPPKRWKVLLLAIRKVHLGSGKGNNQVALLTDADIREAYRDLIEVNNRWVKPFSYGLVSWDVSKLVIENIQASITDQGDHINQDLLLQAANLTDLRNQYDMIAFFWPRIVSEKDPWGNPGAVGGGSSISVPNTWTRWIRKFPREVWLHEWLHVAEGVNISNGFFNGQNGLHGAENHGYIGGTEGEWLDWYRDFMRGKVKEDNLFVGIPPRSWISGSRIRHQ